MANGEILITVTDKQVVENRNIVEHVNTPKPQKNEEQKQQEKRQQLFGYAEHEFTHFVKAQSIQAINYSIANIGNFYGDYQAQRDTQAMMQSANLIKGVIMGGWAGFKVSGSPVGALVGAGVAIASSAINMAEQHKSNMMQINRQNYTINQLRDLSGLNYLTNGSR